MSVFAIGTVGGLTDLGTICLHVASLWPHPPTVIEADPDGGRLAVRHNWDLRPSLADLDGPHGSTDASGTSLDSIAHRLRSGVKVVVAPPAMESVRSAIPTLVRRLADGQLSSAGDVLIDVGVIRPDTPARDIIEGASRRIIVVRKDADELVALAHRRALLESMGNWLVLTAGGRLRADDVVGAIGWTVIADLLPNDRRASNALRTALQRLATVKPRRVQLA